MSTPPPYPFRSRREIHSGEQKVYSDAELHEQHASQDATATPAAGTDVRDGSSRAEAVVPVSVTARGEHTSFFRRGDGYGRDSSRVRCGAASAQCSAGRRIAF